MHQNRVFPTQFIRLVDCHFSLRSGSLILLCTLLCGCLQGEAPLHGVIGGRILAQGKAVSDGQVQLHQKGASVAVAPIRKDGTYSLESVEAGEYQIAIVSEQVPEEFADPQTSGLQIQMEATNGPLVADFEIP